MAHQSRDPGYRKRQARLLATLRPPGRFSRTTLEKLAVSLVERGLCSPRILDHRNPRTNGLEKP